MGAPSRAPGSDAVLDVGQVAELFGYPRSTVYRLAEAGELTPPINPKLPKRQWRWSRARVEADVNAPSEVSS